jgi:hypothetical protein
VPKLFESKVFKAATASDSLKTTVPQSVATVLGLEPGDTLVWEVDVSARSASVRRGPGAGAAAPAEPRSPKGKG